MIPNNHIKNLVIIIFSFCVFLLLGVENSSSKNKFIVLNIQNNSDTTQLKNLETQSLKSQKLNPEEGTKLAEKLIELAIQLNNKLYLAKGYHAKGLNCYSLFRYPEASQNFEKAKEIYEELNYKRGIALVTDDMAKVYSKLSYFPKASEYQKDVKNNISLKDSVLQNEKVKNEMKSDFKKKETQLIIKEQLSNEKLQKKSQELTIKKQELEISNKQKELQKMALLKETAEKKEKEKQLRIVEQQKQISEAKLLVTDREKKIQQVKILNQKKEIELKNIQRNGFVIGFILLLISVFLIYRNYNNQKKYNRKLNISNHKLEKEKQKTEDLLHNILPVEIANELKQNGNSEARQYENVSVLFTDFVNFTGISEKLSPKELVEEIDKCFKAFDTIIEKHNLEKIKTIGDAYLAVSGLPNENKNHAVSIINAAKDIVNFMNSTDSVFGTRSENKAGIRIGVHSGPVVAGIVGVKKFAYDIWGDTVNTAARMEQNSLPGKINISSSTYELVKKDFTFSHRGKVDAKNKGMIDMYFVDN
jgi:class 3 adenylate cyclase